MLAVVTAINLPRTMPPTARGASGAVVALSVLIAVAAPARPAAAQMAPGACCFADGTCMVLSAPECSAQGGTWVGANTPCSPAVCSGEPVVPCCMAVTGTCVQSPLSLCLQNGGAPGPPGGTCADAGCPDAQRACCLGDACIQVPPDECVNQGGVAGDPGSSCNSFPCPPLSAGACCVQETCLQLPASLCSHFGGAFGGEGSKCDAFDCPEPAPGACCLDDGCQVLPTAQCLMSGGHPLAPGTACAAMLCANLLGVAVDPPGDAVVRATGPGGAGAGGAGSAQVIDLLRITLGRWRAGPQNLDPFGGSYHPDGWIMRMELEFAGLVNPPGGLTPLGYAPFEFGERPVFGFIEIDVDDDVSTGGELVAPQFRYLSNVARFGGVPTRPEFGDRVARSGGDIDASFVTPPYVERHGEEFHVALLKEHLAHDWWVVEGDGDAAFEWGETWVLSGAAMHRAHGFEDFTFEGDYALDTLVRFRHVPSAERTEVTVLAALIGRLAPDGADMSVLFGLTDLYFSALFNMENPTGAPEAALLAGWATQLPFGYLQPADWSLTALVGTAAAGPPAGQPFVWTDVAPGVLPGDVSGDGMADALDAGLIEQFVVDSDMVDGEMDAQVVIPGYPVNFHVFDVDYDGAVNAGDAAMARHVADADDDGDVDLLDFRAFQACFTGGDGSYDDPGCSGFDFDGDVDVDLDDYVQFRVSAAR